MNVRPDVVVIGGGTAGENAAWYATDNGMSVVLVERELVGGSCSYWACIPSKTLLRPGEALKAARAVPGSAPAVTGGVDVAATLDSRNKAINGLDDTGQARWLEGVGADLLRGTARLAGERKVEVALTDGGKQVLEAQRAVVLATGSSASAPEIEGLPGTGWWDNRKMTTTDRIPDRLLVLGGGVVGVEMAQAVRRLGAAEVTILQSSQELLPREEPFAGRLVREALESEGVTVITQAHTVRAARAEEGPVTLTLDDGRTFTGDELLVATGRRPNTADVGLESVGLEPGGYVQVDDRLRATGVPGGWLYAVGDVNGRALFTHQGKYQARIAADVIAGKDRTAWADGRAVPRVIFTDPQVGAVGLTERRARQADIDVRTLSVELSSVAAASIHGTDTTGAALLVLDSRRQTVVGATFVGPGVGELVHAATVAIVTEATLDVLWHAVPAFPTLSEVWLRLLEAHRGVS